MHWFALDETVHWVTIELDHWRNVLPSQFVTSKLPWITEAYERPLSPQRDKDVDSKAVAALPSGDASHSFNS